jgi:hypothetical protein
MPDSNSQNFSAKRATWNATLLMLRSAIGIVVGLFTSRIVYNALDVEDYGINAVVGGLVPAFTVITAALASGTSRFLTFEIGQGDKRRIRETFTATFWAHLLFALLFVALAEIGGIYLLQHQMSIPEGREVASLIVLQCSIFTIFFEITQVPYSAILVANERFNIYAYFSLVGTFFGLVAAIIVKYAPVDKLILYSLLAATGNFLVPLLNRIYCLRRHPESHLLKSVNFSILKPILSYSLWDLFSNACTLLYQQSRNYLVNIFFGVCYNATTSVATTVHGAVGSFSGLFGTAFFPQITKQYAQGNIQEMERVIKTSMRFSLLILAIIAIPTMMNAETLFSLWLGSVPDFAPFVLRCLLIMSFGFVLQSPFNQSIHATGRIRTYSILSGILLLLQFAAVYITYSSTHLFTSGFIVLAIGQFIYILLPTIIAQRYIPHLSLKRIFTAVLVTILGIIFAAIIPYWIFTAISSGILQLLTSNAAYVINLTLIAYFFLLTKEEQRMVVQKVKDVMQRVLTRH